MCFWNGGKKWGKENSENKLKIIENNKIREFGDSRVVDYGSMVGFRSDWNILFFAGW